jgi:hypothetical protein
MQKKNELDKGSSSEFNNRFKTIFSIVLLLVLGIGIYLRWESLDATLINVWITRDIDRALALLEGEFFSLAGPESGTGGRLPGPFLYILLALPLLIDPSYESVFYFNFVLNIGSIIGFYFVLKKHFGLYFGGIAAILVLINLLHIDAVSYSINPSFLFPFIVIFLWLLFELCFKKNTKVLPFLILTLSLAIQIHYSISSFYLILLITILILKIKIPFRTIILSLLTAGICFLPYAIYKQQTFIPVGDGLKLKENFYLGDASSVLGFSKIIFAVNSIHRVSSYNDAKGSCWKRTFYSKNISKLFYYLTLISFYFLLIYLLLSIKNGTFHRYKKETIIWVCFYVPAIIYEILGVQLCHYWYNNIFIFIQAILITYPLNLVIQRGKTGVKIAFAAGILAIVVFTIVNSYKTIEHTNRTLNSNFRDWTYKNTLTFYREVLSALNLSPEDYFKRVYVDGDHVNHNDERPPSSKRMVYKAFKSLTKKIELNNNKTCYYLTDFHKLKLPFVYKLNRLKALLSDNSIDVKEHDAKVLFKNSQKKYNKISFFKNGIKNSYIVFEYTPLYSQPCYSNTFNPFFVDSKTRQLLISSKSLDPKKSEDIIVVKMDEEYDLKNQLKSFESEYLVYSRTIRSPFNLKLSIQKSENDGKRNILKTEMLSNSYYPFSDVLRKLSLKITVDGKEPYWFNIVPSNSFLTQFSDGGFNKEWWKVFDIPEKLNLTKNNFKIELFWFGAEYNRAKGFLPNKNGSFALN